MIEVIFDKKKNQSVAYDDTVKIGECDFLETEDCWNITECSYAKKVLEKYGKI